MKVSFEIRDPGPLAGADPAIDGDLWVTNVSFLCLGKTKIMFAGEVFEDELEILIRAAEILQSLDKLRVMKKGREYFRFYFEYPIFIEKKDGVCSFFASASPQDFLGKVDDEGISNLIMDVERFLDTDVRRLNYKVADYLISRSFPVLE